MSYSDKLLKLTKQLYPNGRAWWMRKSGIFEKIHEALTYSESLVIEKIRSISDSILADNENFTTEDASNWERALALFNNSSLSLYLRKQSILRKYKHPGDILYRQSSLYLQGQLQAAGFMVWVHENRFGDPPSIYQLSSALYDTFLYGSLNYGAFSNVSFDIIFNSIYDETGQIGDYNHQRAAFFIGGETFLDRVSLNKVREKEFRELVLKLKPAHTAAILFIDFIIGSGGIGFASIENTFKIS